jgi:hypothetical protein
MIISMNRGVARFSFDDSAGEYEDYFCLQLDAGPGINSIMNFSAAIDELVANSFRTQPRLFWASIHQFLLIFSYNSIMIILTLFKIHI